MLFYLQLFFEFFIHKYTSSALFLYLILLAPHLIFFFQFPPWIFNHWMFVVSFNTWRIFSSVGMTSTLWAQTIKQCSVGNWCLSACQYKCEKHQARTNHWSLTRLASTNFTFGLSLNIYNTPFYFPFWQDLQGLTRLTGLFFYLFYLSMDPTHKWLSI